MASNIQSALLRHQRAIDTALRNTLDSANTSPVSALDSYYGQMHYHLGWVDETLTPTKNNPGKLIRPTLLLLAYEAAGAGGLINEMTNASNYLERALPAAVAVELTHNFTLIHDDIEDGDTERRHRSTLWKVWGVPQAINTGDGMYALSRLALWNLLDQGVEGQLAARIGAILDRTVLIVAEGQYLDISFERRQDISVAMYMDMISRKTAALIRCAAEMGACLGTQEQETIESLRNFGNASGIAFQIRDDILGIWATTAELGKTQAGDVYRRKKSLPILHALEHADAHDKKTLQDIYQQEGPLSQEQVSKVMLIFEKTQTQAYCRSFLAHYCQLAHTALESVPRINNPISIHAIEDMKTVLHFIEGTAH